MKLILDQPIEELKEVSKVSEESMFDLPRPLMISSSFLVTLTCFLIRIFDGSSSFRVLLFPLVAYVVEFPSLDEGSSFVQLMRMNIQDIYQERELVLVVIKVGLLLLGIKLGLIFVGV